MFELNRFLSLPFYPFFSFEFFFSCMSCYVNHAICVVYNILGAVALSYRIYLLPGLMHPFSTAVCWRCGWLSLRLLYPKTHNPSLLDKPLCQPCHPVGYNTTLWAIVLFYRMFLTWFDDNFRIHVRGWLLFRLPDLLFSWPNHLVWGFIGPFFTVLFQCFVKKTRDWGNPIWQYLVLSHGVD